jgi:hypothetical protein
MATIDFKKFVIFTNISHTECMEMDASEQFANVVYMRGTGVRAHALAFDIYKGKTEWNEDEIDMMCRFAEFVSPAFQDSFNAYINKE